MKRMSYVVKSAIIVCVIQLIWFEGDVLRAQQSPGQSAGTAPAASASAPTTNYKGTVTQINAGSGIVLTPNPITTTGTIAVDSSVVPKLNGTSTGDLTILGNVTIGAATSTAALPKMLGDAQGSNLFALTAESGNLIVEGDLQVNGYINNGLTIVPPPENAFSPSILGGGSSVINTGVQGAAIGGGANHSGYSDYITIGGGIGNEAGSADGTAKWATVGGGVGNRASGVASTVPGGSFNLAQGAYSFAVGSGARAQHKGSFVWGDTAGQNIVTPGISGLVVSSADNEFLARATGGVIFQTSFNSVTGGVGGSRLPAGSGSWESFSDRNAKENLSTVNGIELLVKLNAVPIETWNYKAQDAAIRHMGPMAQDFRAAFGLGGADTYISTIDADGVALAGVQALYRMLLEKDTQLREQQVQIEKLIDQVQQLQSKLIR